jgi:hypothetical protein
VRTPPLLDVRAPPHVEAVQVMKWTWHLRAQPHMKLVAMIVLKASQRSVQYFEKEKLNKSCIDALVENAAGDSLDHHQTIEGENVSVFATFF